MGVDIKCKKCGRFLGHTDKPLDCKLKCPSCKSYERYHVSPLSAVNEYHYQ